MASVATVAGHLLLALVTGAGAAARNSIGPVLVGGMTIGSLFTVFVLPSIDIVPAKDDRAYTHAPTARTRIPRWGGSRLPC
jgi:multidrug efflux pump